MAPKKSPAPKGKRAPSPGPKAKAKAKEEPAAPDPKELLKEEGQEMFAKYRDDDNSGVKLKGFAQCIRDRNVKKCFPWTEDDIGPQVVKAQWSEISGGKREVGQEEFVAWWPTFVEMVEAKVKETEEANAKIEAEKVEKAAAKEAVYDSTGVWKVPLTDVLEAIDQAYKRNKTPLIIDNTEGFRVETFFTYRDAHILECKKMIVEKAKGKSVEDLLDEARSSFFSAKCFKYGRTLLFRLANSACDIKNTFNSEAFPSLALLDAAQVNKCIGPENANNWKGSPFDKMCRNEMDREDCEYIGIKDSFRVIAITQFQEEDYAGFLEKMFPLDLCQPIKPFTDS